MDYTILSVAGYPSSMALGRNLFIFENYFLFRTAQALFNVSADQAYLIFKYTVVAQAPLAVIACWVLARDVSKSLHTATLAALFVVFSPVFVLYGGQVMTDVPSVLLLAGALTIHFRGLQTNRLWLVLLGAALLGLGMNLRETIGFYLPWLILAPLFFSGRAQVNSSFGEERLKSVSLVIVLSCVLFLICGLGWFGYWFFTDDHYRFVWHGWRESMRLETERHPVTLKNLWPFVGYFFVSAPLVFVSIPFAMFWEWRRHRLTPMLLLAATGLVANLALFLNYSTAINWRYFLTGLPALAPLCAHFLLRVVVRRGASLRLALVTSTAAIVTVAIIFSLLIRPASKQFIERRAMSKEYRHVLAPLPKDAVLISGSQTIAVIYWKAMGLGTWKTIGTGGGWPGNDKLGYEIQNHLREGRRVFLDSDPRWWLPCGWQRDEIPHIVNLQNEFRFRRVSDTIYELRPKTEDGEFEDPHLERLLPENRPVDTKKCPPIHG